MERLVFVLRECYPKSELFIPNTDINMAGSSTNTEFVSSCIPNSIDVCFELFDLAELG